MAEGVAWRKARIRCGAGQVDVEPWKAVMAARSTASVRSAPTIYAVPVSGPISGQELAVEVGVKGSPELVVEACVGVGAGRGTTGGIAGVFTRQVLPIRWA